MSRIIAGTATDDARTKAVARFRRHEQRVADLTRRESAGDEQATAILIQFRRYRQDGMGDESALDRAVGDVLRGTR